MYEQERNSRTIYRRRGDRETREFFLRDEISLTSCSVHTDEIHSDLSLSKRRAIDHCVANREREGTGERVRVQLTSVLATADRQH